MKTKDYGARADENEELARRAPTPELQREHRKIAAAWRALARSLGPKS